MVFMEDSLRPSHAGIMTSRGIDTSRFTRKGILVIDDDSTFGMLMKALAEARGLKLDYFTSLSELGSFARIGEYDVAVLDYYLDKLTGAEIAEYFDAFFTDTPVVMVSGNSEVKDESTKWPRCVRQFVPKSRGAKEILQVALATLDDSEA